MVLYKKRMNMLKDRMGWKALLTMVLTVCSANLFADKVSLDTLDIKQGETKIVEVGFETSRSIVALSLDVQLPAGLTLDSVAPVTARLNGNAFQYNLVGNTLKVAITTSNGDAIAEKEGALFNLWVTATRKLNTSLSITNIVGSDISEGALKKVTDIEGATAKVIDLEGVNVEEDNAKAYAELKDSLELLSKLYDEALAAISANTTEQAKAFATNEDAVGIPVALLAASVELDSLNAEVALTSDAELYTTVVEIKADIAAWLEAASATEAKVLENNGVFADLTGRLDAVDASYQQVLSTIAAYTTEQGKAYAGSELSTAIAAGITETRGSLASRNEALSLKQDSELYATVDSLQANVDSLSAVAAATEAKIVTNNALYADLKDRIAVLDSTYTQVVATINGYVTEEGQDFRKDARIASLPVDIAKASEALEAANAELALTAEHAVVAEVSALEAQLAALADEAAYAEANSDPESYLLGDFNRDGKVDVVDYARLVDICLNQGTLPEAGTKSYKRADINGDGEINSKDIQPLLEIIINSHKSKK
jgi:hypothetical protein